MYSSFIGHQLIIWLEIVRFYGSECTTSALKNHYTRDVAPNIKALKQAVENGQDPKGVILMENVRTAGAGKRQPIFFFFLSTLHVFLMFLSDVKLIVKPWKLVAILSMSSSAISPRSLLVVPLRVDCFSSSGSLFNTARFL
jgi:hypothetical protein